MKIFVTGGSGFIGSAVIAGLLKEGHEVTGLVRDVRGAEALEERGAKPVVGDLLDRGGWTQAIRAADMVISASGPFRQGEKVSQSEARRRSYYHGQMVGNLFLAGEGSRVRGIVVTYGVQGLGDRGAGWITENAEIDPVGWERTTAGAYWHINKTSRKTRVQLLNVFAGSAYGPGGWFGEMAHAARDGSLRVVGDGSNYMSLIHIDDLAGAYAAIAGNPPFGERYCLVDGRPVTQRELAGHVARMLGTRPPKTVEPEAHARVAGALAAESMTCSSRVSGEKARRLLPVLKYPSYLEGVPAALEAMGLGAREGKAA